MFKVHYKDRIHQINKAYEFEDEESDVQPVSKKLPLNLGSSDDALAIMNPKLVDVDWRVIYTLNSKNLNKTF